VRPDDLEWLTRLLDRAQTQGQQSVLLVHLRPGMIGFAQPQIALPPGTPTCYPMVYRVDTPELRNYVIRASRPRTTKATP
jgi:hypothetical protein